MQFFIFITTILMIILISKEGHKTKNYLKKVIRRRNRQTSSVFDNQYIESKVFYTYRFRHIPSVTYVSEIDITAGFTHIKRNLKSMIVDIYQFCYFDREEGKQKFTRTLFVLSNEVVVELYGSYAEILYRKATYGFADKLLKELSAFRAAEKEKDFEINIITLNNNSLELKALEIKHTELDISLYYNEDFSDVDQVIRERLAKQNDKGIILLHGLPGTGKTTYLRHLVGSLTKKVLFVAPSVAGNLMNPEFIDLLIDNPNAVLIIEDAENIILDRKYNSHSSVSNLLNLSDGLLSDCLNVQIICTFNNDLAMLDPALLRKGRLIARYEFGKLKVAASQRLSDHLGFKTTITRPMTLAEIAHQHEKEQVEKVQTIGFRRNNELVN